jgi:hypothetical protein
VKLQGAQFRLRLDNEVLSKDNYSQGKDSTVKECTEKVRQNNSLLAGICLRTHSGPTLAAASACTE